MQDAWSQPSMSQAVIGTLFGYSQQELGVGVTILGEEYATEYVIYTVVYFGVLFGGLLSLMLYNLAKMFGVDVQITAITKELFDWFTTPPLVKDDEEEDSAAMEPSAAE